jgi:hypothetical protein
MRLLDILGNSRREQKELSHLFRLRERLARFSGSLPKRREELLRRVVEQALPASHHDPHALLAQPVSRLVGDILTFEGLFLPPSPLPPSQLTTARVWEEIKETIRALSVLEEPQTTNRIVQTLAQLTYNHCPAAAAATRRSGRPIPFCAVPFIPGKTCRGH